MAGPKAKGPYTQQIEGVLPAILTDDIISIEIKRM